ncbi:deoxyribonuclease IV [Paenibacillus sp.]|uniref:deoxyribonuclease IV n=1 Tax=Paenibacillus sp. TaxID=58172 RepID=UPI002D2263FF|nr:deoxyribonuclease IV [Paenibacillus sp.]HZG88506.1 deoxyribonuclease IV [Paenibacillus sp.]
MTKLRHVGCHISIKHGYSGAAQTAAAIGATAFQYFPKNPRGLAIKDFSAADAAACAALCRERGIRSIAHTTYATNLAAEGALREPTIRSLRNDLEIAEACGSVGVVVHFGKWKGGKDPLEGYKIIISALNETLDGWNGSALLLIENQAGEGTSIGATMEEHVSIRQLTAYPEKIGFCLDTCHLFASGVWNGDNWRELLENGRAIGYMEHLKALHLNDSVYPTGARRDRHANIGAGAIGAEPLAELLRSSEFAALPVVLETPVPVESSHQAEIEFVRTLA